MEPFDFFKENEHFVITGLHYGKMREFTLEELYQEFKQRILKEMSIARKP